MNYFTSDIHGAEKLYFKMKDHINFKNNDELYIIGDIFDGNKRHPEACLKILDDIMKSDNIHLLLGNHEYAHVMYHLTKENVSDNTEWTEYVTHTKFGGEPLLMYMENNLSKKEKERYLSFLISQEVSALIQIGQYYFYLVHGSPVACKNNDVCQWQQNAVTSKLSLTRNYALDILSDPEVKLTNEELNKVIIIAGQVPTRYIFKENEFLLNKYYKNHPADETKYQKIIFENKRMFIDCGCKQDTLHIEYEKWAPNLACVGIDTAGFFTEYIY